MNAKIVELLPTGWKVTLIPLANLVGAMKERGYVHIGFNFNKRNREELQGKPVFGGIVGPMWDGDAIRYECPAANEVLSV